MGNCRSLPNTHDDYYYYISDDDDTYEERLQLQEVLMASMNISTTPEAELSSPICCQVCTEDRKKEEMFQIEGCSHSFCSVCISRHVESKLESNVMNISCLSDECQNMIQPATLKSVISSDVMAYWEHQLSQSTIPLSQKYYCPFPDCREILLNDDDEGGRIRQSECPNCRRLFCVPCNVPWHDGHRCGELKRDTRGEDEFRRLAEKNKWPSCPKCGATVEKTEGCIHMSCW